MAYNNYEELAGIVTSYVNTTGPACDPVLIFTVYNSSLSIIPSIKVVIVKEPIKVSLIVKLPSVAKKSAGLVVVCVIDQYSVVPSVALEAFTFQPAARPSSLVGGVFHQL